MRADVIVTLFRTQSQDFSLLQNLHLLNRSIAVGATPSRALLAMVALVCPIESESG